MSANLKSALTLICITLMLAVLIVRPRTNAHCSAVTHIHRSSSNVRAHCNVGTYGYPDSWAHGHCNPNAHCHA